MDISVDGVDAIHVVNQLCAVYPPNVLKDGLWNQEQLRVVDVTMENRVVKAGVWADIKYNVRLDLDFAHLQSRCACKRDGGCAHIAAVAFALYALFGNPRELVESLVGKQGDSEAMSTQSSGGRSQSNVAKISNRVLDQEGSSEDWLAYLESCVRWRTELLRDTERYLPGMVDEWFSRASHWLPKKRLIFTLLVHLFVLSLVQDALVDQQIDRYSFFNHTILWRITGESLDGVFESAKQLRGQVRGTFPPGAWSSIQKLTRKLILNCKKEDSLFELSAFRMVWNFILFHVLDPAEEIRWIERAASKPVNQPVRAPLSQAKAWLLVMLNRDLEAMDELIGVIPRSPAFLVSLLDSMQAGCDYQRLYRWLSFSSALVEKDVLEHLHLRERLIELWLTAAEHVAEADEDCYTFLRRMLPFSHEEWTDYLIRTARYEIWVDYHLAELIEPWNTSKPHLRCIESKAPGALFPYYHQMVERYVLQKNRDSYRYAVKLLKQLKILYRKQRMLPEWERFLGRFCEKHCRLRALAEEMKKGAVIA